MITVNNTDRAPALAAINDQTVNENSAITQINSDDSSGGDTDIDGDTISYTCLYDTTLSGDIVSGTNCSSHQGQLLLSLQRVFSIGPQAILLLEFMKYKSLVLKEI